MKKLLILMLVLGMASAANATTLTWSADAITLTLGSDAVVQISANDDQFYTKYAGNSASSIADITGISARANAGDNPAVVESPPGWGPDWWKIEAKDASPPSDVIPGIHWDVTLHPLAVGTYEVYSDYYGTIIDMLEITVVPEPATIALLGLGGLFLMRRRKK